MTAGLPVPDAPPGSLRLFAELVGAGLFVAVFAHAAWRRGRDGALLFGLLAWLGFARETVVILRDVLYGFAPLSLMLGPTPFLAATVWSYSIWSAMVFAEEITGDALAPWAGADRTAGRRGQARQERKEGEERKNRKKRTRSLPLSPRLGLAASLFMMALAAFYEPFLTRLEMARWQTGTLELLGVPAIALVGYPTMLLLALGAWAWATRRFARRGVRTAVLVPLLTLLAAAHALGLQALKDALGW